MENGKNDGKGKTGDNGGNGESGEEPSGPALFKLVPRMTKGQVLALGERKGQPSTLGKTKRRP
jgi:hypothetical protein